MQNSNRSKTASVLNFWLREVKTILPSLKVWPGMEKCLQPTSHSQLSKVSQQLVLHRTTFIPLHQNKQLFMLMQVNINVWIRTREIFLLWTHLEKIINPQLFPDHHLIHREAKKQKNVKWPRKMLRKCQCLFHWLRIWQIYKTTRLSFKSLPKAE